MGYRTEPRRCTACNGSGRVRHGVDTEGREVWWECSVCDGARWLDEQIWVDDDSAVGLDSTSTQLTIKDGEHVTNFGPDEDVNARYRQVAKELEDIRQGQRLGPTVLEDVAKLKPPSPEERRKYALDRSLQRSDIEPSYFDVHQKLRAEAIRQSAVDYETFCAIRDGKAGFPVAVMEQIRGDLVDELASRLAKRLLPLAAGPLEVLIEIADGLGSFYERQKWDNPANADFRIGALYSVYVRQLAEQLEPGNIERRNQMTLDMLQNGLRIERWKRSPQNSGLMVPIGTPPVTIIQAAKPRERY